MTAQRPSLLASSTRQFSGLNPVVTFPTSGGGSWPVWWRFLAIRGVNAFEIGNICGTCEFWFSRLEGEAKPVVLPAIQTQLAAGIDQLDEKIVGPFASLLEAGAYRVSLFKMTPELVLPGCAEDYFANEQEVAWPENADEGPNDPGTPYYRVAHRCGVEINAAGDLGFEFVVPLQKPASLDVRAIAEFQDQLTVGAAPTTVAVGVLDVKQYYDSAIAHWCLSHYILDGHHKVEAAARSGKPITLLSFISVDHSIMNAGDNLDQLLATYN